MDSRFIPSNDSSQKLVVLHRIWIPYNYTFYPIEIWSLHASTISSEHPVDSPFDSSLLCTHNTSGNHIILPIGRLSSYYTFLRIVQGHDIQRDLATGCVTYFFICLCINYKNSRQFGWMAVTIRLTTRAVVPGRRCSTEGVATDGNMTPTQPLTVATNQMN